MKTVIFERRASSMSWFALALGFVGASAIVLMGGKNVALGMGIIAAVGLFTVLVIIFALRFSARHQVVKLTDEDGVLEATRFALFGTGTTFLFHHTETSNWRWKSKPSGGAEFGTLAFTYAGSEYFLVFKGAVIKDFKAFEEIAPFLLWA